MGKKEVLVVYGNRRRPVSFDSPEDSQEAKQLLEAVKLAFSDLIQFDSPNFYLQISKPEKWGDQLIDVVGPVPDGSTVYLVQETTSKVKSIEGKASSVCKRVGNPSESTAGVLAKIFNKSTGSSRKRSFDPSAECCVASQKAKKKATNQRMKPKKVTVVLLKERPASVPKGHSRKALKNAGRIAKIELKRCMSESEVRDMIVEAFPGFKHMESAQFLRCSRDNVMLLEAQELDGDGAINLAGQGSLYLSQKKVDPLLSRADEVLAAIRESKANDTEVVSIEGDGGQDAISEETIIIDDKDVAEVVEIYATKDNSQDLAEWRALRQQQNDEYEESLRIDQMKEQEKAELEEKRAKEVARMQERDENIQRTKSKFVKRFEVSDASEGCIPIGFKYGDGKKVEFTFSSTSTIKNMYQFVFVNMENNLPFTLHYGLPQNLHAINLSKFTANDLLKDFLMLRGRTVMVREEELDFDEFLNLLDEEPKVDTPMQIEDVEMYSCAEVDDYCSAPPEGDEKQRLDFMKSIGASIGPKHIVSRSSIYEDVISLYEGQEIVRECPIYIGYSSENAIDEGGVSRDMFSAFWEAAYKPLFDGSNVLVPFVHPSTDMSKFFVLGRIISHGYLSSGFLPVCINCPSLISMLLGITTNIPKSFLLDALMEFVSANERDKLRSALLLKGKCSSFSVEVQSAIITILSRFDCREMPTPSNLADLIVKVATYQFCYKPIAALAKVYEGIPEEHKAFWRELGVDGVHRLYISLTVSAEKVLNLLECDVMNPAEECVFGYLTTMIGNMSVDDARNFLRFTTGSSVCIAKKIKICFNNTCGSGRHPFANTCSNTLELPVSYLNYQDFFKDWSAIFSDTNEEWKWCMDEY